jgi:nucleoside-diphosphate-sugar epimerase
MPVAALRAGAHIAWLLRLQPSPKGWVDMALGVPLMDTSRARTELGWTPAHSSEHALLELLTGIRDSSGADTPPLAPDSGGPLRVRELLTGIGAR